MTRQELMRKLDACGIDRSAYSLTGGKNWNERYCLDQRGQKWVLYYAERGGEKGLREFTSEAAACEAFFAWITGDFR